MINPYLNRYGNKNELGLQESLLIELIQMKGMDVIYFPRVLITKDDVLNEIVNSYHSKGMVIEMLLESYEEWENNGMDMNVFGLMQMPNVSNWLVSKRRFTECVDEARLAFGDRPNEGDIIFSPKHNEFFKIKKVNKEDPTKTKDRWMIRCEKYDDADNINVDSEDFSEEIGTIDPRINLGFGDIVGLNDYAEEFIEANYDIPECLVFDPESSASEVELMLLAAEKHAMLASTEDTINKKEDAAKNALFGFSSEDFLVHDPKDPQRGNI